MTWNSADDHLHIISAITNISNAAEMREKKNALSIVNKMDLWENSKRVLGKT